MTQKYQNEITTVILYQNNNEIIGVLLRGESKERRWTTRYEGYERYQTNTVQCPQTFQKMITTFGMPKQENVENVEKSKARLYFDNTVKVTEDFVSYDLLRFGLTNEYVYESFLKIIFIFSMVAEIGGYSGLLIGFSMMDLASIFSKAISILISNKNDF